MDIDTYKKFFRALIVSRGLNPSAPSGEGLGELYFGSGTGPLVVPIGEKLTPDQRAAVVARMKKKFDIDES